MAPTFMSEGCKQFRNQTVVAALALPRNVSQALVCHPVLLLMSMWKFDRVRTVFSSFLG